MRVTLDLADPADVHAVAAALGTLIMADVDLDDVDAADINGGVDPDYVSIPLLLPRQVETHNGAVEIEGIAFDTDVSVRMCVQHIPAKS